MTRPLRVLVTALFVVGSAATTAYAAPDPCRWQSQAPPDGHIDELVHVAGKDTMGITTKDGKASLQVGNTGTGGSGLTVRVRAAFGAVDFNGSPVCIAMTNLVFAYGGKMPMVGDPQRVQAQPAGKAISHMPTAATPAVFYVDVNEKKSVAGMGSPTIEYVATGGTFRFTAVNTARLDSRDKDERLHKVAFDITFSRVLDQASGKLDPGVQTRLKGTFSFTTLRPLR